MSKPSIYMHLFEDNISICEEFGINVNTLDDCHVYLAYYHMGDYDCDGSAFVLYEDESGELFEVHGAHCSCHGLATGLCDANTQWEPEATCVEALHHRLTEGSLGMVGGYDNKGYYEESKVVVDYLLTTSNMGE